MDQAGKKRRSITDGLGRMIRVDEPDSNGNLDDMANPPQPLQPTSYLYDALDDLAKVTQSGQARYFLYDSLKRLIRARNPEQDINTNLTPAVTDPLTNNSQWCVKYAYDADSNLSSKTDARNITTNYNYDNVNRATSLSYVGDPQSTAAVSFYYDSQTVPTLPAGAPTFNRGSSTGRLVGVLYGGGNTGTFTGYDQLGRVVQSIQVTETQASGPPAPQAYGTTYSYNRASEMITESYPSGRVVQTEYDTGGRIAGVRNQGAPSYYAGAAGTDTTNRIQYSAHGAMSAMKLGNGKWEHTLFNERLQPTEIGLGATSAASDLIKLEYKYGVLVNTVLDTTQNNGNIQSQIITAPKAAGGNLVLAEACVYDSLNRLAQATETGGTNEWSQTYSYDRFGNRAVAGTIFDAALTPPSLGAFDSATNRIKPAVMTGFSYDTAGSVTSDPHTPANGIIYDAENRQTSYTKTGVGTTSYSYDGDGHRVKKTDPSNNTTIFVYNVVGQLIAEYTSGPPSGNGTSYLTSDHLGSTRVVTSAADINGNVTVKARYDYLPFGEEIGSDRGSRALVTGYGAAEGTRQKFTQKERDSESGMDFFATRYYASAQGRFTAIDPIYFQKEMLVDPQRFNLYVYTRNNPLRFIDPTGMILQISGQGDPEETKKWLEFLAGDLADKLRFTAIKDNSGNVIRYDVAFDASEMNVAGNEGAQLVFDLVNSDKVFLAQAGGEVEYKVLLGKQKGLAFKINVTGFTSGNITRARTQGNREPVDPNVDSIIYISKSPDHNSHGDTVEPISSFIHEAAESYLLAQGVGYNEAHGLRYRPDSKGHLQTYVLPWQNAISREARIRLQLDIKGAPAGMSRVEFQGDYQRTVKK